MLIRDRIFPPHDRIQLHTVGTAFLYFGCSHSTLCDPVFSFLFSSRAGPSVQSGHTIMRPRRAMILTSALRSVPRRLRKKRLNCTRRATRHRRRLIMQPTRCRRLRNSHRGSVVVNVVCLAGARHACCSRPARSRRAQVSPSVPAGGEARPGGLID